MKRIFLVIFILYISINIRSGSIPNPERESYYVAYQDDQITILHPMNFKEREIIRPMNDKELHSFYQKYRSELEKQIKQ